MKTNYYYNISITTAHPKVPEIIEVECNHILILDETAHFSFQRKTQLTQAEKDLIHATQAFHKNIGAKTSIESIVIDRNLTKEPLASRFTKVQQMHVSMKMDIDSTEIRFADSPTTNLWLDLVPTIARISKEIFSQCDTSQSTFTLYTSDNRMFSCSETLTPHASSSSFKLYPMKSPE